MDPFKAEEVKEEMFSAELEKFLWEGIIFLAYVLICGGLTACRFSKKVGLLISGGMLVCIVLLEAALVIFGQDATLVLTMLPLTAYLPAILCLHLLSRSGFFQTMAVWTVGTIVYFVLKILWKILIRYLGQLTYLPGWGCNLLITLCLLLCAGAAVFLVFRFLRKPFQTYVLENQTNWLLLSFPVCMIILLFSYFASSTTNVTILTLLLLTALSIFLVLIRVLTATASIARLRASEKNVSMQMQIQRREYENVCKKMEMGRTYRHDMRHHLLVLGDLAQQGDTNSITQYIENLNVKLSDTERESYCENTTVNAVLSSCIGRAKETHCAVTANIDLPKEIPFDAIDVCMVLANALENAVNACAKIDEEKRYIHLTAMLADHRKLTIAVENPCETPVSFDADGFPIVPERAEHGIGLKSIDAVTKKYNGMFDCECEAGVFRFKAVLFSISEGAPSDGKSGKLSKRVASGTLLCLLAFFLVVNCVPSVAQALSQVPGLGTLVRLADLRSYQFRWGDTSFQAVLPVFEAEESSTDAAQEGSAQQPDENISSAAQTTTGQPQTTQSTTSSVDSILSELILPAQTYSMEAGGTTSRPPVSTAPTTAAQTIPATSASPSQTAPATSVPPTAPATSTSDISDAVEDMNQQMEAYIEQMEEEFLWYVARKYEGYVGMDTFYQILRNDDTLLSVRFETTINVGGSVQYSRCFTLDKRIGKVLVLGDLFRSGSDYIDVISAQILRQMTQQVEAGEADYFIPGGIWSDDECFQQIANDQNFYINDQNQLVIVFDEYEVAPGSMGMPEFVIPTAALESVLQQPCVIGCAWDN